MVEAKHVLDDPTTDREERRQGAIAATVPGHDGSKVRLHRPGLFVKTRQRHRAGVGVSRLSAHVRTGQDEAVADRGNPRQEIGESNSRRPRGDR